MSRCLRKGAIQIYVLELWHRIGEYGNDLGLSLMPGSGKFWVPKHAEKITNSYQDWRVEGDCCFAIGNLDLNFISMAMESPHEKPNAVVRQWYLHHGFLIETYSALKVLKNTADKHKVIVY